MAEPATLCVRSLTKSFGALHVNDNLCLDLIPGEVHGLIGPNGAGKTTAISLLAGEQKPDQGEILFEGEDITGLSVVPRARLGIARSNQITSIMPRFTSLENLALALWTHQGHGFRFFRRADKDSSTFKSARDKLEKIGLAEVCDVTADYLSHGQQRLLELAMALAQDPKLLLLDEPMAGMGQEGAERVISVLEPLKGRITMLLVEHDMDAVFRLADRITVLVEGTAIAVGTPEEIRANGEVRIAYLGEEGGEGDA